MSGNTGQPSGQHWDPARYSTHGNFVAAYGAPVVDRLAPAPGESVLDLGCGDGALTLDLMAHGCEVIGVDASADMVAAARVRGVDARVMDGQALAFEAGRFDAVFSNAALHWMPDAEGVLAGVARVLRPGGRFVGEMGGAGNVATILSALESALAERGLAVDDRLFFPSIEQYSELLIAAGLEVDGIETFARPTPLPGDVGQWIETFARTQVEAVPAAERETFVAEVVEALRPALCDADGDWTADYVRLRFTAIKPRESRPDYNEFL